MSSLICPRVIKATFKGLGLKAPPHVQYQIDCCGCERFNIPYFYVHCPQAKDKAKAKVNVSRNIKPVVINLHNGHK